MEHVVPDDFGVRPVVNGFHRLPYLIAVFAHDQIEDPAQDRWLPGAVVGLDNAGPLGVRANTVLGAVIVNDDRHLHFR